LNTLQSNIQAALDANPNIGAGNTLVVANSSTSVAVTFQGVLGFGVTQPVMTWSSNLTGPNASVSVSDSGLAYYGAPSNDPSYIDPTDGVVSISGTNTPPTANNDSYAVTARDFGSDPGLAVPSGPNSILANDTSPATRLTPAW
jgi:hypothetical protein